MSKHDENTVFCTRHGAVEVTDKAEIVPGVFVPICSLCHKTSANTNYSWEPK